MSVLHTASFKEFGSLVCLWQALKHWKMQLKIRSLNVTWRRDLWGHRVIVFYKCAKLLAEQLWQIWRRYMPLFFSICEKTWGGLISAPRPCAGYANIFGVFYAIKPASLCARNNVFIFIETISMNFNPFYGIIANQRTNTMVTHKTPILQLSYATIFEVFYAKKTASTLRSKLYFHIHRKRNNISEFQHISRINC